MEKKTKHRILGMLVVTGLVIISLPLLQSVPDEPTTQLAVINPPPFPEQSADGNLPLEMQVSSQPDDTIPARPRVAHHSSPSQPVESNIIPVASQQPLADEPIKLNSNTLSADPLPLAPKLTQKSSQASAVNKNLDNIIKEPAIKSEKIKKPLIAETKNKSKLIKKIDKNINPLPEIVAVNALDKNGLSKFKQAVWVVQLGSFKDKIHALRLVNTLRAKGYSTFIQQVNTPLGESTRVFVGPETQQAAARNIANKLETELHLRGFVISYKPFAL